MQLSGEGRRCLQKLRCPDGGGIPAEGRAKWHVLRQKDTWLVRHRKCCSTPDLAPRIEEAGTLVGEQCCSTNWAILRRIGSTVEPPWGSQTFSQCGVCMTSVWRLSEVVVTFVWCCWNALSDPVVIGLAKCRRAGFWENLEEVLVGGSSQSAWWCQLGKRSSKRFVSWGIWARLNSNVSGSITCLMLHFQLLKINR